MNVPFEDIFSSLAGAGVSVDASTLKKHHAQGYMSEVHTVQSNLGHLIVHVMRVTETERRLHLWDKLQPLSRTLRSFGGIPVSDVLYAHALPGYFVVFQRMLPGGNAGERRITSTGFTDIWYDSLETYAPAIERFIARLHSIPVSGFGLLAPHADGVAGPYATWKDFLETETVNCIPAVAAAEELNGSPRSEFLDPFESFLRDALTTIAYDGPLSIVHFDLTNPSNILVQDRQVTGFVDWEFATAADPAWEFSYKNSYTLDTYFEARGITGASERKAFQERVELYSYLCFFVWLYLRSSDPADRLYTDLRAMFLYRLKTRGY